jgi:hypothetical protein
MEHDDRIIDDIFLRINNLNYRVEELEDHQ